jgi:hypothetical protein
MDTNTHQTYVYIGLAGEGQYVGAGGLYRSAAADGEWQSITTGLPANPQVRALLVHPQNPAILYAGTHLGPYRSDDRGEHWEALDAPQQDVWSLALHPRGRPLAADAHRCRGLSAYHHLYAAIGQAGH